MNLPPPERCTPSGLATALQRICPNGVYRNVDLSEHSRWKIGGLADLVVTPSTDEQVKTVCALLASHEIRHVTLGYSSNLLFADEGLHAVGIFIGQRLGRVTFHGSHVEAQAGVWVPGFARLIQRAGLAGAEHMCGIPGTLGGLIWMNGGSQRRGVGDNIISVTSVDSVGQKVTRSREECGFRYRSSVFQETDEIIVGATLDFPMASSRRDIRRSMLRILKERRSKFPRKLPNCGSVFVSDPATYQTYGPPGAIIERCGLKGVRYGGAEVSPHHANFIVNTGSALAADVLSLIGVIRRRVIQEIGYAMPCEVRYVQADGRIIQAHEADEVQRISS